MKAGVTECVSAVTLVLKQRESLKAEWQRSSVGQRGFWDLGTENRSGLDGGGRLRGTILSTVTEAQQGSWKG